MRLTSRTQPLTPTNLPLKSYSILYIVLLCLPTFGAAPLCPPNFGGKLQSPPELGDLGGKRFREKTY